MPEPEAKSRKLPPSAEKMIQRVGVQQTRAERARKNARSIWNSIAILGVVGWSVALPTLVGVAIGIWIDHRWPSRISWTVILMFLGLILGCTNAWMRIKGERS
jgi:ATP synthase protein I